VEQGFGDGGSDEFVIRVEIEQAVFKYEYVMTVRAFELHQTAVQAEFFQLWLAGGVDIPPQGRSELTPAFGAGDFFLVWIIA